LKSRTLRESFYNGLYDALREFETKRIDSSNYKHFLDSAHLIRPVEEALKSAQYIKIELRMTISDGPSYELSLLYAEKQVIVNEYVFFHWLRKTQVTNPIEFGVALGAVFIESSKPSAIR